MLLEHAEGFALSHLRWSSFHPRNMKGHHTLVIAINPWSFSRLRILPTYSGTKHDASFSFVATARRRADARPPSFHDAQIVVLLRSTSLVFLIRSPKILDRPAMKGTSTILLAVVVATALVAVAKPSHSNIAALLLRHSSSGLHARSGIDPSSITTPCRPVCTTIIEKLDVGRLLHVFALGSC